MAIFFCCCSLVVLLSLDIPSGHVVLLGIALQTLRSFRPAPTEDAYLSLLPRRSLSQAWSCRSWLRPALVEATSLGLLLWRSLDWVWYHRGHWFGYAFAEVASSTSFLDLYSFYLFCPILLCCFVLPYHIIVHFIIIP